MPKAVVLALAVAFAAGTIHPAAAWNIMVEEGKPAAKTKKKGTEKRPEKRPRPRGSSYVPNLTLPRTVPPTVAQPSPGVYQPPPVDSFGDRVTRCNHSFPSNAGIGNNPIDRDSYVRQCAN